MTSSTAKRGVLPIAKPVKPEKAPSRLSRKAALRPISAKARRRREREAIYTYGFGIDGEAATCFLAQFDPKHHPCTGRMDHAHLIPRQLLRKEDRRDLIPDARTWVPACRFHHVELDNYRGLIVPREALPPELEKLCEEIGLDWFLTRRYGPHRAVVA